MQERAVAAVRIAGKVEPGGGEIGREAEHHHAGGTGGFFRQPELERGVAGGGEEAGVVADGEGGDGSLPGLPRLPWFPASWVLLEQKQRRSRRLLKFDHPLLDLRTPISRQGRCFCVFSAN